MGDPCLADDSAANLLERRWFAAERAASEMQAECAALVQVMDMAQAAVGGALDAWTLTSSSPSFTAAVIPSTHVAAGTYVLEIRGEVSGAVNGSYAGVLNATPVPLPAALPLLLSGLSGLGFWGRRRSAAIA